MIRYAPIVDPGAFVALDFFGSVDAVFTGGFFYNLVRHPMKTIRVCGWAGFKREIHKLRETYSLDRRTTSEGAAIKSKVLVLFRGQADSKWDLLTTLERRTSETFDVARYAERASRIRRELESFTGRSWSVPDFPAIQAEIMSKQQMTYVHLPSYDYLVFLRHHGFPSPLLDWTESPFIAAYFAYVDAAKSDPVVFCYVERPNSVKGGTVGDASIQVCGKYVTTDKRHFAQKAWYTIATKWSRAQERHTFCRHSDVFARDEDSQDLLFKIVLPRGGREEAMHRLSCLAQVN